MRPQLHGLLETVLYVADLDRSQSFYTRLFGLQVLLADERMRGLKICEAQILLLFRIGGSTPGKETPHGLIAGHGGRGTLHLAFSIAPEDVGAWRKYLQQASVEIESENRANLGHSIYFRDPDGHAIELGTAGLWRIQDEKFMAQRIDGDSARFRSIVRGKIREGLKGYISQGEMVGRKGRDMVSIPLPQINLPQFRHGDNKGGVGAGAGDVGDPLGGQGDEPGPPGEGEGDHPLEVEVSLSELAEILGEELGLPRIEPRGKKNITHTADKYNGISTVGPNSLRHFRRTYKQALRRQMSAGEYNPQAPKVVPIREDTRYKASTPIAKPEAAAVVLYAMDVSGSMGAEQKELVRITSFWIDAWLKSQYGALERCFLVHDVKAREVSEDDFYRIREGGGTKISSAYELMNATIDARFSPTEWNVYGFHFSDGDNWSDDNDKCLDILEGALLPKLNQFAYGQVASYWGSGQFMGELRERCEENEAVVTAEIGDRDAILKAIKSFLVKGR